MERTTFHNFLSGASAGDYVFQKIPYEKQLKRAAKLIKEADYILIGAGAGLSAAAGFTLFRPRRQNGAIGPRAV